MSPEAEPLAPPVPPVLPLESPVWSELVAGVTVVPEEPPLEPELGGGQIPNRLNWQAITTAVVTNTVVAVVTAIAWSARVLIGGSAYRAIKRSSANAKEAAFWLRWLNNTFICL